MKILIIDDEPLVRRSLCRAARALGYDSCDAADGEEGLKKWRETMPDAVFVDILMPGMGGPDVVRTALKIYQEEDARASQIALPKIALISAFSGDDSHEDPWNLTKECGADLFIEKPFEDIFEVIKRLIGLRG